MTNKLRNEITKMNKHHPCIECIDADYCKDEEVACKVFYKYYVNSFVDKESPKGNRQYWVWQRADHAGSFSSPKDYNPRIALSRRYRLYKVKDQAHAYRVIDKLTKGKQLCLS